MSFLPGEGPGLTQLCLPSYHTKRSAAAEGSTIATLAALLTNSLKAAVLYAGTLQWKLRGGDSFQFLCEEEGGGGGREEGGRALTSLQLLVLSLKGRERQTNRDR